MSDEPITNAVVWQIHDTHPDLVEPLRAGLALVIDPEIGMNVIQLGLIRDASVIDDVVRLKMILTTPFCPYGPAMIESTRMKAQEAINKPVTIEMGPEVWDFSMMEDPSALDWGLY
jgi:metal-sulfur cluster biosynthetic enzyme